MSNKYFEFLKIYDKIKPGSVEFIRAERFLSEENGEWEFSVEWRLKGSTFSEKFKIDNYFYQRRIVELLNYKKK